MRSRGGRLSLLIHRSLQYNAIFNSFIPQPFTVLMRVVISVYLSVYIILIKIIPNQQQTNELFSLREINQIISVD